jgi:formimidoylglutamate deiminase
MTTTVRAALTWTGSKFERDVVVSIGSDGTFETVGAGETPADLDLPHEALLPGFVNAHSHSFQRALRGRTERFPEGKGSFWIWREAMYGFVETVGIDAMYDWNRAAFEEMLAAGITSVGEFHYLHHLSADARDHELDRVVLDAAADAGIRITLLQTFYRSGGIGVPLSPAQERFATPSVDDFLRNLDELGSRLSRNASLGIVAHSVRAVPLDDIEALARAAKQRRLPFHIHLEEQRKEIEDTLREFGKMPMALLLERIDVDERATAVHCTHSRAEDLDAWIERGANVCITPLTEGNLGDGIQPAASRLRNRLALGTDCNARISMLEEMRWLEYVQRLKSEDRGVFRDEQGDSGRVLLRAATAGGARSLGISAGSIATGQQADLVAVDLTHPALTGWSDETLLDALIFGCDNEVVLRTCVGGTWMRHRRSREMADGA